jgi:hypothetical protein
MLKIPHCLDNRLTDDGKVVGPMHIEILWRHIIIVSINLMLRAIEVQHLAATRGKELLVEVLSRIH